MNSFSRLSRRSFLAGGLIATGAVLAACSGKGNGVSTTGTAAPSFPVSIDHAFGTTTISEKPSKVATVGYYSADVAASLGVIPLAAGRATQGATDSGSTDWLNSQISNLGANNPTFYDESSGINTAALSQASPDLILCLYGNITAEDYQHLSAIAPTVVYTTDAANWAGSWQDATRQAGLALGKAALAEQLIAETETRLKNIGKTYPALAETTYIAGYLEADSINIYAKTEAHARLLGDMGLKAADIYDSTDFGGNFYQNWTGAASQLDSTIFLTALDTEDSKAEILANLDSIPAIKNGGLLGMSDARQPAAFYSTLGINWLLDKSNFINNLVSAAAGHGSEAEPTAIGLASTQTASPTASASSSSSAASTS
ncbi:MAG: ABC transporter substrate-binding protein [Corynebacterium sp.]|nr:ABC transporter substrate-binding protein [Corynebacterium sp.]